MKIVFLDCKRSLKKQDLHFGPLVTFAFYIDFHIELKNFVITTANWMRQFLREFKRRVQMWGWSCQNKTHVPCFRST